jgi:hypothetical protein
MPEAEITFELARLKALIDQWRFDAFQGSFVARDVGVWNFVHAATEDLKQRLAAAMPASA